MKNSLLFFLLSILLLSAAEMHAQWYYPFPDSGVVWSYLSITNPCAPNNPPCTEYATYYYVLKGGDTLISGNHYLKLYKTTDSSLKNLNKQTFYGGIRQDISNKKIFYASPVYGEPDQLLYDFSKKLGDTIKYKNSSEIIYSIDSILISGKYRKRINGNHIEGIGSQFELIRKVYAIPDYAFRILCFDSIKNRQMPIFQNALYKACYYDNNVARSIDEKPKLLTQLTYSVEPNPIIDNAKLLYCGISGHSLTLKIYDITGANVFSKLYSETENEIDIQNTHFPSGIYLFRLIDNHSLNSIKGKLVFK